jgi:hypothetical protein
VNFTCQVRDEELALLHRYLTLRRDGKTPGKLSRGRPRRSHAPLHVLFGIRHTKQAGRHGNDFTARG